ncbi:MAG: hypothetical protein V4441_12455 [Pseudomonadota bacterium]|tara:strand:- start:29117 stop:29266 length:150 start_codon:yes stop_codon:yes gene_type:complete
MISLIMSVGMTGVLFVFNAVVMIVPVSLNLYRQFGMTGRLGCGERNWIV